MGLTTPRGEFGNVASGVATMLIARALKEVKPEAKMKGRSVRKFPVLAMMGDRGRNGDCSPSPAVG